MEQKTCSFSNCKSKHYARGFCRKHYRSSTNEGKRYWEKVRLTRPDLVEKSRDRSRNYWHEVAKFDQKARVRRRVRAREYYHDENTGRKEYLKEWKRNLPEHKKRDYYKKDNDTKHFSNYKLVKKILDAHNNCCAMCFMSNDDHINKYSARLSLHHKDGSGRNVPRRLKNNDIDNLIPLCKPCHQRLHMSERKR